MDEACAEMILNVDNGPFSHMYSRDPLEIWETPERVHRAVLCDKFGPSTTLLNGKERG